MPPPSGHQEKRTRRQHSSIDGNRRDTPHSSTAGKSVRKCNTLQPVGRDVVHRLWLVDPAGRPWYISDPLIRFGALSPSSSAPGLFFRITRPPQTHELAMHTISASPPRIPARCVRISRIHGSEFPESVAAVAFGSGRHIRALVKRGRV